MKNIKRLLLVAVLGLGVCGLTIAQVHRSGAMGHDTSPLHADAAAMAKHFAEVFPQIAAFDMNKDGKLDESEREALGKGIADGTLQFPAHTPPHGAKPSPEMMLNHIAEMYGRVALYDVNHDNQLDENEQAALRSAIEQGEFAPQVERPHAIGSPH